MGCSHRRRDIQCAQRLNPQSHCESLFESVHFLETRRVSEDTAIPRWRVGLPDEANVQSEAS